MREWLCPRCERPFTNPTARGEHAMGCRETPPPPAAKRADPGKKLEERVKDSAKALAPMGLSLRRTSPRTAGKHGPRGKFVGRTLGKGGLDFEGDFNGRAVMLDAKSCARGAAFPLSYLKDHQVTRLRKAHLRGAIAFFLVEMTAAADGPRYFALTWPVLEPYFEPESTEKSVSLKTLDRECHEIRRVGRLLDLVAVIKTLGASIAPGGVA